LIVGVVGFEKKEVDQEDLGQDEPHEFVVFKEPYDLRKVREIVRQEKKKEQEEHKE